MSPRRVVLLSALIAAGTSVATTLLLRAADVAPRASRSDASRTSVGTAPADGNGRIRELEESVARIGRALEEEDVPLDAPETRKNRILADLMDATPEQQLAVREAVRRLAKCGDAVVPDLVALLASGRDVDYGGGYSFGGNMFTGGYPRLRTVLIDALRQIGTPAARDGLLNALGDTTDPMDYRDLLLMYGRTTDMEMVRGISGMIPGMLAKVREGGEVARRLDGQLSAWIDRYHPEGAEDLLAELVSSTMQDGRPDPRACAALIDMAPDRAFLVIWRREAKDREAALRRFGIGMRWTDVSLANVARFCDLAFSRMEPDRSTRMALYLSLPNQLDKSIVSREERAADGKVLLEFVERRLRAETDENARRMLARASDKLAEAIAACEQKR